MKIKTLGVLVILLPLLATGCKQANTPTVEVPSVPEVEIPEIDLIEIDKSTLTVNLKEELLKVPQIQEDFLLTGKDNGWLISNGTGGQLQTRSISVINQDSEIKIEDIVSNIVSFENVITRVDFFENFFEIVLLPKDGYYFSDKSESYKTKVSFLKGGFIIETKEDFQSTLDSLVSQSGNVTIDLLETIINENSENGKPKPFEIVSGDEKLNLTFKSDKEGGAEVNGGGILTSLIVSGANTTVTVGKGITINGGLAEAGGGVIVKDGAHFILDGGIITGNTSTIADWTKGGGAVSVLHGTFTMNSGSITGNAALRGAGVFVSSTDITKPSTFIMNGGSIDNNTTVIGAVEITGDPSKATGGGSGIFAYGSGTEVILNGGEIRANSASRMGSAITASTSATLTINDGLITENIGPYGVIGTAGPECTVNLLGGRIEGNVYGPLNEDGTPNMDLIADTDGNGTISKWVGDIEYGVVEEHAEFVQLTYDPKNGTYIEGAGPKVE